MPLTSGKELVIAGGVSRAYLPIDDATSPDTELEVNVICTMPVSDVKLHQLKTETHANPSLQQLMKLAEEGWPNKKNKVLNQCLPFWNFHDQISFSDGVLFKGEKIIIPRSMQAEILKIIHT